MLAIDMKHWHNRVYYDNVHLFLPHAAVATGLCASKACVVLPISIKGVAEQLVKPGQCLCCGDACDCEPPVVLERSQSCNAQMWSAASASPHPVVKAFKIELVAQETIFSFELVVVGVLCCLVSIVIRNAFVVE